MTELAYNSRKVAFLLYYLKKANITNLFNQLKKQIFRNVRIFSFLEIPHCF